jgi:DNA repair exonuclease SbcCD ATPase subunit
VEEKLRAVRNSEDIVEGMQVQLRKLEDAMSAAEEKYQRLEKKNEVLEETTGSIERNFKALEETEDALRRCSSGLEKSSEELESLRPAIEKLAGANEKAKDTMGKLELLDTELKAVEDRIEKMQVAREWLARAETRFTEINKQANEQVKLLEAIAKDDGKAPKSGKGAPTIAARENVIKLARSGWGVEEIARSLKLSRGEVDLILEIGLKD